MSWITELFGTKLLTKDGLRHTDEISRKKVIGVYFSAHWCPPCRTFTPMLSEFYEQMVEEGKEFEVIFVSSDADSSSFDGYFSEMPWKAIPYSETEVIEKINTKFAVRGIPNLIVLDGETGDIVDAEGRVTVVAARGDTDSTWGKWCKH